MEGLVGGLPTGEEGCPGREGVATGKRGRQGARQEDVHVLSQSGMLSLSHVCRNHRGRNPWGRTALPRLLLATQEGVSSYEMA